MDELRGKVAVVTGAASGIGLALAERFVDEGMRVVASDVEEAALEAAGARLRERGGEIATHRTDVADAAAVDALAEATWDAFGACHVLCNNAGVLSGGAAWEIPIEDWQWVLGVNLYGVVNGVRSFVPRMLGDGAEGHVVNVASMAAVTTVPFASVYHVSKHGVLAYSECLTKELRAAGAKIGVSVLCPEMIDTQIGESDRNRPAAYESPSSATHDLVVKSTIEAAKQGLPPSVMADRVVQAIHDDRFYILSEGESWREMADTRSRDLLAGRNPTTIVPEG